MVDAFDDRFGEDNPTWALAVKGHYVRGTKEETWGEVPREDRPQVLAAVLWSYVGDAEEYDNRLLEGYLKRAVRMYETDREEVVKAGMTGGDKKVLDLREKLEHVDLEASG